MLVIWKFSIDYIYFIVLKNLSQAGRGGARL